MTRRDAIALLASPRAPASARVAVIAHRGEHQTNPENTVAAMEAAIRIGCDYVEIDVRTTRDGGFVLMHGDRVDSTTGGSGAVADLTLAEIRRLRTGGQPVPTLDEALETLRGRCGVYLDAKRISAQAIIDALVRHGMAERAAVYGGYPLLKELADRGYSRIVMPEAVSLETLRKSIAELKPRVVAFDRRDFREEIVAAARKAGVEIFVDRLGPDDHPESWRDAVALGATGIQTDRPAELHRVLASLGRRA